MFFDTKNSASLSLTEDENLLIQESMSDLQMPNNVEVGSPTTRAVFTDASDWNGLDNATVSAHPTANSTASPEDEAKRPATYKDLERLFREADSIDQWSPLRPDPANRKSVTRTINSNYLEQFGTQPLEEETAVVHCEYCNKALSKKFLPRHIAKTCRKVDRSHSTTAASSQSTVVASGSQPSAASLLPAPSTEPGLILGEEELLHSGSITTLSGQVPTIVTNGKGKTTGLKTGEPKPKNKPRKMTKAQEKKAQKLAESAASTNSTEETLANTSEVLGKRSIAEMSQYDDVPGTPAPESSAMPSPTPSAVSTAAPPEPKKRQTKKKLANKTPTLPKPNNRVKGPIDLDKQCGVMGPNGQPCARSLTCKTHSMGAKRAVLGRSQLYDLLLKAHLAKSRSAAAAAKHASDQANGKGADGKSLGSGLTEQEEEEERAMSSDEEVDLILRALQYNRPQPLAVRVAPLVRRRHHYLRIRDVFLDALQMTNGPQVLNE